MTEETAQEFGTNTGRVLRFFNRKGYGFIEDLNDGDTYFIHNSEIMVKDNIYRKLYPGEYVSYNLVDREGKQVCSGVRGIMGYPLLVENEDHSYRVYPKESRRVYGYNEDNLDDTDSTDDNEMTSTATDELDELDEPDATDATDATDAPEEVINKVAPEGIEVAEFDGLNISEEMG